MVPWDELDAPAVLTAPFGGKSWRSAPDRRSGSTLVGVPANQQEELPAVEPEVLVEQGVSEVLETSDPVPPAATAVDGVEAAATAASTAGVASAAAAGAGSVAGCCCQMQLELTSSCDPRSPSAYAQC